MICPECNGEGRVQTRFLFFFTRWARCRKCLGSGEFPPPVAHRNRYMRLIRDEDRDAWQSTGVGMGAMASRLEDVVERETTASNDAFEVGSGGRSGGGGASASWGDAPDDAAPLIVDPFVAGASAVGAAIAAEASGSDSSTDGASADSTDSSSADSGTSY